MKYKIKKYLIDAESPEKAVEIAKKLEETNFIDFDYLLGEERKAVKDYQNAIEATDDKDELYVLSHILQEETHHIELLENLRQGKVEFADCVKDSVDYNALAKDLQNKFNKKFVAKPDDKGIYAPSVYGNYSLDKKIVQYLKSKGYKVMWDEIGDDGYYYITDSVKDSSMSATQEDILMQYAVKYHIRWREIEQMFEEFIKQGMDSKAAVDEVINKIKSR